MLAVMMVVVVTVAGIVPLAIRFIDVLEQNFHGILAAVADAVVDAGTVEVHLGTGSHPAGEYQVDGKIAEPTGQAFATPCLARDGSCLFDLAGLRIELTEKQAVTLAEV